MGKDKVAKVHRVLGTPGRAVGALRTPAAEAAARQVKRQETLPRAEGYAKARELGRALREKVPRSAQGTWEVQRERQTAVDLILSQDAERLPDLVPLRHERMAASPFAFFRGAALPMAADLATLPSTDLIVQACGDAHIANFGGYRSPESHLVFDLNDFDETSRAPWEWDVKRLVASVVVCGRTRGFGEDWCAQAARLTARSYRHAMAAFADQGALEVWRTYIDVASVLDALADEVSKADRRRVAADLARAFSKTNIRAFEKLVTQKDGAASMVYDPPEIVPLEKFLSPSNVHHVRRALKRLLANYLTSLSPAYRQLLGNYELIGIAQKVVGVGSVGTRCWVAVFTGTQVADPLVIQVKEAAPSVLERFCGISRYASHGERVVQGQRLMQATSDPLLGWGGALDEQGHHRDYYARQLWSWKMSVDLDAASADELEIYGQLCGWTLARAHARSGDRGAIAGYLGKSDKFDRALARFALAYADQNEADYEQFLKRLGKG